MRWLLVLGGSAGVAAGLLLACSGSDSSAPGSPSPEAGDDSASPTVDSSSVDNRVFPVALGRTWTYALTALDGGTIVCPGPPTAQVTGQGEVRDGGASLRYRSLCLAGSIGVDMVGDGDEVYAYTFDADGGKLLNNGVPYVYIDSPIADGHEWTYTTGIKFRWRDAGSMTVKAGSFSECWSRDEVATDGGIYDVFCRGVGQVYHHNTAGNYNAELTAKSF